MIDPLHILHGDGLVGRIDYDRKKETISLHYEDGWRFGASGFPVSVSLPMETKSHGDLKVRAFLQGLLPDNNAVLEAWGKRFHVSPRNPFDLIKHMGEDCAGGLQFIRPERLDLILSGELDSLKLLTGDDLEGRLRNLKSQARSVAIQMDGRFSLAGVQTKDALHRKDGKWYLPGGRIPTTHILKPQPDDLEEHAVHEHFCLELVSRLGLPAAKSEVLEIGGMKVLSVDRFDRLPDASGARVIRLHQEDTCQALGHFPDSKYENEGGPTAADIVRLLRAESSDFEEDCDRFVMALAINWVIYGSDAHSKNFSLIHAPGSYVRLAPLYDIASNLPYDAIPKSTKRKLAMKVGGDYLLHKIGSKSWRKFAEECGLDPMMVEVWVGLAIDGIAEHARATAEQVSKHCETDFIGRLCGLILERVEVCRDAMGR